MDRLWAPWRMEYLHDIRRKKGRKSCVFCDLEKGRPGKPNLVLYRGKYNYVVMNRFPYATGHLLVVTNSHTADLGRLPGEAYQEMVWLMKEGMQILAKNLGAQGFNCGLNVGKISGGGIPKHMHWHIVPRWKGDLNFMPILGNVRVLSEYLSETYKKLEKHFKKLKGGL